MWLMVFVFFFFLFFEFVFSFCLFIGFSGFASGVLKRWSERSGYEVGLCFVSLWVLFFALHMSLQEICFRVGVISRFFVAGSFGYSSW